MVAMLAVNLTGVFLTFREGLRQFDGWGRLIAVASTAGIKGYAKVAPYAAAKHGVMGIVRSLALEVARDPHLTLREVERVLVPEGRVVICGFNPNSLWGLSKSCKRGFSQVGDFIGQRRLRDWLQLLSFEVESTSFGC